MAKSLRSKTKRSFRNKKREEGIYAATEAARLNRLNSKLVATASKDKDGDVPIGDAEEEEGDESLEAGNMADGRDEAARMDLDNTSSSTKRISTHGPRGSRNEEWRKSKGLAPRPKSRGMNRQGGVAAKRKAGKSARRR